MVQVLPYVPGFGEQLAQALGQGISNVGQGYAKGLKNKADEAQLKVITDPNSSPMNKFIAYTKLTPEKRKGTETAFASLLGPEAQAQAEAKAFGSPNQIQQPTSNQVAGTDMGAPASKEVSPGALQQRQGLPIGSESGAEPVIPGAAGIGSGIDERKIARNKEKAQLRRELPKKAAKSSILQGQGIAAERRLQELDKEEEIERKELETIASEERKKQAEIQSENRQILNKPVESFFNKIEGDRIKIPQAQLSNDMIIDAIKNGDTDPWSAGHIAQVAKSFGVPSELTRILETPGSKEFSTARKTFIGNTIKDAFRGTTTTTEINLVEEMLSEIGATKWANLSSAFGIQAALDIDQARIQMADQLKEEGVSPAKIPPTVDKMLRPYEKLVKDEYFEAVRELRKKSRE